jgi:hypothetical protein
VSEGLIAVEESASSAVAAYSKVSFCLIKLKLNTEYQCCSMRSILVVNASACTRMSSFQIAGLSDYIMRNGVAIATGWWGENQAAVAEIAIRAGAMADRPIAALWKSEPTATDPLPASFLPLMVLVFAAFKNLRMPAPDAWPSWHTFLAINCLGDGGEDWKHIGFLPDVQPKEKLPMWPHREVANVTAPHLHKLLQKNIDVKWEKMGIVQIPLWVGASKHGARTNAWKQKQQQARSCGMDSATRSWDCKRSWLKSGRKRKSSWDRKGSSAVAGNYQGWRDGRGKHIALVKQHHLKSQAGCNSRAPHSSNHPSPCNAAPTEVDSPSSDLRSRRSRRRHRSDSSST